MKESSESKGLALLRILQIYQKYSDCNHPLTQAQISNYLQKDYGIYIERKNIGRKISLLREALEKEGIYIESCKKGTYLDNRIIEDSELKMLIDGVLSSKYITAKHSKDLITKLSSLSNVYFKNHIKSVYSVNDWQKTDNQELFYNIEIIDEAIEKKRKVTFNYNKYGIDKKLHKSASHTASPYQLILHNQKYYLVALNEKWGNMGHYRLDHITDINISEEPLTDIHSVEGYKYGLDYSVFSSSLPYMFTDKPEKIEFVTEEWMIDQIVEWFGFNFEATKTKEKIKISLTASPIAMEYWAMQYLNNVEIIKPEYLREKIKKNLECAIKKYN